MNHGPGPITVRRANSRPARLTVAAAFLALAGWLLAPCPSQAVAFITDFNSGLPPGSTVVGTAFVDGSGGVGNSGVLKLTVNAAGQSGGYVIDDFNGGNPVTSFKLVARVAIGGGTDRPADGMAFAFGTDLSGGPFGEEGEGTGIIVSLDTWDNQTSGDVSDTAPAIELKYAGAVVASQSMAGIREGGRPPNGPLLLDGGGNPVSIQTLGAAGDTPRDSSYVNLIVELFSDNTVSLSYSNVLVFNRIPIPYAPISGGRFAFGARTGGATEDHWIDNLAILVNYTPAPVTLVSEPADQTATEGRTATFTVGVDDTPPYRVQWFKNKSAIPGATELFYTTPPTALADSGGRYHANISNAESAAPITTRDAVLTVAGGSQSPVTINEWLASQQFSF